MIIKWPWTRKQIEAVRPDMTRRRFLATLAAVPVAAALAPELVDLLRPPKMISLPPRMAMSGYLTGKDAWYLKTEGGIMRSADFRRELAAGLNEVFSKEYGKYQENWRGIFGTSPPDVPLVPGPWNYSNALGTQVDLTEENLQENIRRVMFDANTSGFGLARAKQESGVIAYDHIPATEYEMRYAHQVHALGFTILPEGPEEDLTDYEAVVRDARARRAACGVGADHSYNQVDDFGTESLARGVDGLVASVDRAVSTVDQLPAAAEKLGHDIATSPIDLVKRILRS